MTAMANGRFVFFLPIIFFYAYYCLGVSTHSARCVFVSYTNHQALFWMHCCFLLFGRSQMGGGYQNLTEAQMTGQPWFVNEKLTRGQCEAVMKSAEEYDFVVRTSLTHPGNFCLVVKVDSTVRQHKINAMSQPGKFMIQQADKKVVLTLPFSVISLCAKFRRKLLDACLVFVDFSFRLLLLDSIRSSSVITFA